MTSQSLVLAVIEAVAYADGKLPEELEYNLYEYVDLEIFTSLDDRMNTAWEFSFELPEHTIRVTSDEFIFVDGVRFEVDGPPVTKDKTWTEEHR